LTCRLCLCPETLSSVASSVSLHASRACMQMGAMFGAWCSSCTQRVFTQMFHVVFTLHHMKMACLDP
jgi:hypothetical protein